MYCTQQTEWTSVAATVTLGLAREIYKVYKRIQCKWPRRAEKEIQLTSSAICQRRPNLHFSWGTAQGGANVGAENDCMHLRAPIDVINRQAGLLIRPGDASSWCVMWPAAVTSRRVAAEQHIGRWMRTDMYALTHTQITSTSFSADAEAVAMEDAFTNHRVECKTFKSHLRILSHFYTIQYCRLTCARSKADVMTNLI